MLFQTLRSLTRSSATCLLCFSQHASAARRVSPLFVSRTLINHRRRYSTPAPRVNESSLSMSHYHEVADKTMDLLLESLEELHEVESLEGYDVEFHSGVLTLNLGPHGTYVVNKQPPNRQIWLSSPFSGPKRYDYIEDEDKWVYSRDGRTLHSLLSDELSTALGRPIDVPPPV